MDIYTRDLIIRWDGPDAMWEFCWDTMMNPLIYNSLNARISTLN